MNSGILLGTLSGERSLGKAAARLIDRSVPACVAVPYALQACKKHQRPARVFLKTVHSLCVAPTGSGKGRSVILNFLLTNNESCVITDVKGENYLKSALARRRMGQTVVCIDPFNLVGGRDTLDPLDSIGDARDPHAPDACAALANSLVMREPGEKEPHWNDSAEARIKATLALIAAEGEAGNRSIQSIRPLLTDPEKMATAVRLMQASRAWGGCLARFGHQLTHARDKELASILTTTNRHLSFLDTPAVIDNTSDTSFNPEELRDGKMTVYLVLPPVYQRSHAALMRMWLGTLMRVVISKGLSERRVHFVIDEAASLGNLPILFDALDKYRGYGVRLQLYYQSMGQLKECWPNGADQTLLSNTSQIFFAVQDLLTAEYVSNRCGSYTAVTESGGHSDGGSSSHDKSGSSSGGSRTWGTTNNWSQVGRKLLMPEEVLALHPRQAISFSPGLPPLATWLSRYDEGLEPQRMSAFLMVLETVCWLLLTAFFAVIVTAYALKPVE